MAKTMRRENRQSGGTRAKVARIVKNMKGHPRRDETVTNGDQVFAMWRDWMGRSKR